jgi:signal transduction histidine kinase
MLMRIVFTLVVPGTIGFAIVAFSFYRSERDHIAQSTIATARALVSAVDRDLVSTTMAAQVLAASPLLQTGDFAAFHREAGKLVSVVSANSFILSDASGQELVNTLRPYGEPLPFRASLETLRQVFRSGKPVISDVFMGAIINRATIAIDVPVFVNGEVKYSLAAGMFPERLSGLLVRQRLPPHWIAAILDTTGVIAARTHSSDRFVGRKGAPVLLEAMANAATGVVETNTMEGVAVLSAFSRSEISNWTVAIGIPVEDLSHDLDRLLLFGATGALGLLIAGLALAWFQAAQIAREVQDLIPPALALGRGEVPDVPPLKVREPNQVGHALARAYHILKRRTDERDRAERQKDEQAKIVTATLDEFISNMSHELRTPMTSIVGPLGLLEGGAAGPLPPRAARLVSVALSNARRLGRLVNDIIDIGKIESGKIMFDFVPVDLRATLEEAVDSSRASAKAKGVVIRLDKSSASHMVQADRGRLIQAFNNLLSNAVKFSPQGGEILVTTERGVHGPRVIVRDHGSGIPDDFKPKIFEKFAQAETGDAKRKGGSGLGLSIVAMIMAQHGGTVGFEDAPGGGTRFYVEIPLSKRPEERISSLSAVARGAEAEA